MSFNCFDNQLFAENTLHCKMHLQNKELWQKFNKLETEMIITKSGRRMFPALRVQIEHLDPNAHYCVMVEMVPISKCRYKYSSAGGWTPAGSEEAQSPNRMYIHTDSPATGNHWMSQVVTFGRLKLTNTAHPPPGQLVLSSMHRYQPRIIIAKTADPRQISWAPHMILEFPETKFIAVTAYQNDKITKLKIDNNPFAKGFRENGQSKCKRKLQLEDSAPLLKKASVEESYTNLHSPTTTDSNSLVDTSSDSDSSPEVQSFSPLRTSLMGSYSPYIPTYPYVYGYRSLQIPSYDCCSLNWSNVPGIGALSYPYYNQSSFVPQNLTVQKVKQETPKKLTDFSIRAITGLP